MNTQEKLSALVDGELDELNARRLLKICGQDNEVRQAWERYHVIRAAMTRQLDSLADPGFADRVMARLEQEGENVTEAPLRFWPLAGGFAAAATVAAIAILSLQTLQQPLPPAASAPMAVASTVASSSKSQPVAAPARVAEERPEERLNAYLVGHNEFMPTAGMGGMLPYVRVVSHQQEK